MRTIVLSLALAAVAVAPAAGQRNFDDVEIDVSHVAGSVYLFVGAGGNIGVSAGDDGLLMVDDQFAPLAPKIQAALDGLNMGALEFVVNTHFHGDHTGGNEVFGVRAPIMAHLNVRRRLGGQPAVALPVITFDDDASIHFNGEEVKVVHYPTAHTDGDSVIFFTGSDVVHMGDHYFFDRFPFVDVDNGGNAVGMMRNINHILGRVSPSTRIIPGHGPLAGVADLRRYRDMLETMVDLVTEKKADGKTLEQIQSEGVPAEYESWGAGFINAGRWIESVYRSLD